MPPTPRLVRALALCFGVAGWACAEDQPTIIPVVLGERATNLPVRQRVVLPIVGPVKVQGLTQGGGMVTITPLQPEFQKDEVVAIDLDLDLHGAEFLDRNLSSTVRTSQGNFTLEIFVKAVPFTSFQPSRFGVTTGSAPVPFTFRGAGLVFSYLVMEPADAPVSLTWALASNGSLKGQVGPPASLSEAEQDGVLHHGRLVAVTASGDTDFIGFNWFYPKTLGAKQAPATVVGGGN